MAVGDVYQSQVFYHAHDRQFITSFFYRETVEDTGPWPTAGIGTAWGLAVAVPMQNILSDQAILGCIKTTRIIGDDTLSHVAYFNDAFGTGVTEAAPGSSAQRYILSGENHSRPNRGALIISGWAELGYEDGAWTPGAIAGAYQPFINAVMTDLVGGAPSTGEWEFGYMSRANATPGGPLVPYPGVFVRPSSMNLAPQPQTLRSRQTTYTASRSS